MKRGAIAALAVAALAGCAIEPVQPPEGIHLPAVGRFSAAQPGDVLPSGWRVWQLSGLKRPTEYRLVDHEGRTVVFARARSSASGLVFPISVDPKEYPYLQWHWNVPALIHRADNTRRATEDSPARIVIAFDGDRSKLPFEEQLFAEQFRLFTKQEFPYALLMYIWENRAPVGSVIENLHTSRIRMIVADSGDAHLGTWRAETRNIYEDYKRAFGEEPVRIRSVGIMTDTDNTGEDAKRSTATSRSCGGGRRNEGAAGASGRSRARSMIAPDSTRPGRCRTLAAVPAQPAGAESVHDLLGRVLREQRRRQDLREHLGDAPRAALEPLRVAELGADDVQVARTRPSRSMPGPSSRKSASRASGVFCIARRTSRQITLPLPSRCRSAAPRGKPGDRARFLDEAVAAEHLHALGDHHGSRLHSQSSRPA